MGHSSVQIDCKIVDLFETPEIPFGYEFKDGNLIHQTAQINWEYLDIGVGNNRLWYLCGATGRSRVWCRASFWA